MEHPRYFLRDKIQRSYKIWVIRTVVFAQRGAKCPEEQNRDPRSTLICLEHDRGSTANQ